jgi:hypothetical protein
MTLAAWLCVSGVVLAAAGIAALAESTLMRSRARLSMLLVAVVVLGVGFLFLQLTHPPVPANLAAGGIVLGIGAFVVTRARRWQRAERAGDSATPLQWATGSPFRLFLLPAGLLLVLATITGLDQSRSTAMLPAPGSIVDAANGEIVPRLLTRVPRQPAQIAGGHIFRACDLSAEARCSYPLDRWKLAARPGDLIQFKFRLHNPGPAPLPYATFVVSWSGSSLADVLVQLEAEWPLRRGHAAMPPSISPVGIDLPGHGGFQGLAYVPGSAVLLDQHNGFLGRLPDGLMENGIALADIGAPASCFYCDLKYVRFVSFRARVNEAR